MREGDGMNETLGVMDDVGYDWRERLDMVVAMMREMSTQTDAQEMRRAYTERIRRLLPVDASLSLSRRDLSRPRFRITRSSHWKEDINPWKEKARLPLLEGGLLSELIYGDQPRLFDDLEVPSDDPAWAYLTGFRSLAAIPMYDQGAGLNMVVLLRHEAGAFSREQFPQVVWMSNLFGRATLNLLLSEQLKTAYEEVDFELKAVADMQRSLLPARMPKIPNLAVAAHYQTSRRAGGDYYDFFPLDDGRCGLFIADVSGHGTPAAVLMAVTHSLAHTFPGSHMGPGELLEHINRHLATLYTVQSDTFVTAFYGLFDPRDRSLTYASAGHNPPRLKRCQDGSLALLNGTRGLPLGILPTEKYGEKTHQLMPGDQLVLYTDGITEAQNAAGEQFGLGRLDKVLEHCNISVRDLLRSVLDALEEFTAGEPAHDDRTLLVAKVS
jgi:sigma-B regulation protein RsbU (phosphoserine phosphatase)